MELTNHQIDSALSALTRFNPDIEVPLKVELKLCRNHRKLKNAWDDVQHDRIRLAASVVADQSKVNPNGNLALSAAEQQKFEEKWEGLLQERQDVDVHPLELYSSKDGERPKDPPNSIDRSKIKIDNAALASLIDIVFIESNGNGT